MRSVEISAKTLEEASKAAAFQLGADEDDLEIEILAEPRKILGVLGGGEYRIRATYVKPEPAPRPPAEEIEEPETPPTVPVVTEGEAQPEPEAETVVPTAISSPAPVSEQPAEPRRAIAERAQQITQDITALMGIPKRVEITNIASDQVELEIEDDEGSGLLIGRYGTTLDALQLIVAMGANAGITDGCRVILDIHGYRRRRDETLRSMAQSHATQAKQTSQPQTITDLKGYERRIIHMELRDDPEVETYSEGQGRDRRIVIAPASTRSES